MASRTTKVILAAEVQGYVDGMDKAARATRETGSEAEKLAQQSQAFTELGRASMIAGGAIAAGLVLSTKAAIDWDSAWAGVTKTVDGSPEQLAAVEAGLRDLTSVLPASHTEIAAVAEAAGQLGIQTPNVVAFTKTMIDLGETTNLTSEQAATQLARFMNVMGTSQDEVSALGSALVDLGNNYATTEAEILEMSMRLSGAGRQIGLSEGEVLGLSTALSSVGIEAEAGGSAMSKVMIDIASSAEQGGDRIAQFAEIAGMSADEFTAKWKSDPATALATFVTGLGNAEAQGKSTLGILDELGITEVRMRDALLRSASASEILDTAMQQGNTSMEENTALTAEAEKRYETTAAKLQIMANRVVDGAIALGDHLLPAVEGIAEGLGGFGDVMAGLDGPMGAFVAWGGVATAGVLLLGGAALLAVPQIAAFKVALETLNITGTGVRRVTGGIGRFLMGPWGIAMAAAAVSVAVFNAAMDRSKTSAEDLEIAIKQGDSALDAMRQTAEKNEQGLTTLFVDVSAQAENLGPLLDKAADSGRGFFSAMTFNETAMLDNLGEMGSLLGQLASTDLPRAQDEFSAFATEADLSREQLATMLGEMPAFKKALLDYADANGVATDDTTLLKLAMGEIKPAAEDNVDSLEQIQDAASDTSNEVNKLADEIRNFGSAQFDTEKATIQFYDALDSLKENLDSGKASLDVTTEAGRDTGDAMLEVASKTNDYAASLAATGATTEEIAAALEAGRQRIINTRMALGESREAAELYADSLVATPKTVKTQVELAGIQAAKAQYESWIQSLSGRKITVIGQMAFQGGVNPSAYTHANGGLHEYADGGIQEFAGGGFPTGIYSGGTPIHKFAEPETGWEAYISGKPDQRDRNRQIWVDAGERLGMGGVAGEQVTNNISLTLQAKPGETVGSQFARINHELRAIQRGGVYRGGRK